MVERLQAIFGDGVIFWAIGTAVFVCGWFAGQIWNKKDTESAFRDGLKCGADMAREEYRRQGKG